MRASPTIQPPGSELRDTTPGIQVQKTLPSSRPRVGFLGVGWIGRNRLQGIAQSGLVDIVAIADPSAEAVVRAQEDAPGTARVDSLDNLLDHELDGVVIATPSARHAAQAQQALKRRVAVFCQKPLGRCAAETEEVVEAAKTRNLLLGVDFSYRFITGIRKVHDLCRGGELGTIYAIDLIFHNAYGPDKHWFYDPKQSGGGCVMDLGIHLVDLALWNLGFSKLESVAARLWTQGKRLQGTNNEVEDYAEARLDLANGASIRLTCSWKLPAGCDAVIVGSFYGTKGGASFRNVNGSFYEFAAERFYGTRREPLASGPEAWGSRAAIDWAQRLAAGEGFAPSALHLNDVARAIDAIYDDAGVDRMVKGFS